SRAKVELARTDFVDHLLAQSERRFFLSDVTLKSAQLVIGPRKDLVVEADHEDRDAGGGPEHWRKNVPKTHTAGLHCSDLVLRGKPRERVQRRHKDCHGERQGNRQRKRKDEKLPNDAPWQPLADQLAEPLGDVL